MPGRIRLAMAQRGPTPNGALATEVAEGVSKRTQVAPPGADVGATRRTFSSASAFIRICALATDVR